MADLLLNAITKKRLDRFMNRPSHAVLFTGEQGSGLRTIAAHLSMAFAHGQPEADSLVSVEPNEKNIIPIEEIRALSKRLKLRNERSSEVTVSVVISSVESMQPAAQNALLKLLEEPPYGVLFILLTHEPSKVLPTISSRCVRVDILPVSLIAAEEYFDNTSAEFIRNYHLSGGQVGLMHGLINDKSRIFNAFTHLFIWVS